MQIGIQSDKDPLEGVNSYADWHLRFAPTDASLRSALGLAKLPPLMVQIEHMARYQSADTAHNYPLPRLMSVDIGEWASVLVSPVDGRLLGFEMLVGPDTWQELDASLPVITHKGAIELLLDQPYDTSIFYNPTGWIEPRSRSYPDVTCQVSATEELDRFPIQFLPAPRPTMYDLNGVVE